MKAMISLTYVMALMVHLATDLALPLRYDYDHGKADISLGMTIVHRCNGGR